MSTDQGAASKVKRIHLTPKELRAAIQRANRNVKHWAVWNDPGPRRNK